MITPQQPDVRKLSLSIAHAISDRYGWDGAWANAVAPMIAAKLHDALIPPPAPQQPAPTELAIAIAYAADRIASVVPPGRQGVFGNVRKQAKGVALMELTALTQQHAASNPAATELAEAIEEVVAERKRQIESEGWSPAHDDTHVQGELAQAAACYAAGESQTHVCRMLNSARGAGDCYVYDYSCPSPGQIDWPWDAEWYKPTPDDRQRELTKAIALLLAEKERLYRLSQDGHG